MAGKHLGGEFLPSAPSPASKLHNFPHGWWPKLTKAYAEGRQAAFDGDVTGTSPHPVGSPADTAWITGWENWTANVFYILETAVLADTS